MKPPASPPSQTVIELPGGEARQHFPKRNQWSSISCKASLSSSGLLTKSCTPEDRRPYETEPNSKLTHTHTQISVLIVMLPLTILVLLLMYKEHLKFMAKSLVLWLGVRVDPQLETHPAACWCRGIEGVHPFRPEVEMVLRHPKQPNTTRLLPACPSNYSLAPGFGFRICRGCGLRCSTVSGMVERLDSRGSSTCQAGFWILTCKSCVEAML